MSLKNWKDHKGKVLAGSVAAVALAPVLSGHAQHEDQDQVVPMSNYVKPQLSPSNQATMPMFHTHMPAANTSNLSTNDNIRTVSSLSERESSSLIKETFKATTALRLIKTDMTANLLASESIQSVWPEETAFKLNDNGPKVEKIQTYLKEIGYYVNEIDGNFGPKTQEAVKLYQKDHGLTIDGIVGQQTIAYLIGTKQFVDYDRSELDEFSEVYLPNQSMADVYTTAQQVAQKTQEETRNYYQKGDKHKNIETLQQLLKEAGYYTGPIDGIFGNGTLQAVRLLQQEQNLIVDGYAGNQVFQFLKTNDLKKIAEERERNAKAKAEAKAQSATGTTSSETKQTSSGASSSSMENIIAKGQQLIGSPYVWGGTSPSGFDCSGFLVYLFNLEGMELPRSVSDIWGATTSVSSPERGDIVFFETYKKGPSHAGIYLGDGAFLHTGTSTGVTISYLSESYWDKRYLGARRY